MAYWMRCVCMLVCLGLAAMASAEPRNFQQILKSGELRIGVSEFPPWVMQSKEGQWRGAEIDVGERLAKDMHLKPRFTGYRWDELIPALVEGKIDVIASGMAITPERALKVNFSDSYGDSEVGLVANKALTEGFKSMADLRGSGVGIALVKGTVSAKVAKRLFPKARFQMFDSAQAADKALLKGEVHALVASSPTPRYLALRYPAELDMPLSKPLMSFPEAFALRKGDPDWLNFLDSWVAAREADGWLASTRRYWFETLNWKKP